MTSPSKLANGRNLTNYIARSPLETGYTLD